VAPPYFVQRGCPRDSLPISFSSATVQATTGMYLRLVAVFHRVVRGPDDRLHRSFSSVAVHSTGLHGLDELRVWAFDGLALTSGVLMRSFIGRPPGTH
jgi:hypothetical protein